MPAKHYETHPRFADAISDQLDMFQASPWLSGIRFRKGRAFALPAQTPCGARAGWHMANSMIHRPSWLKWLTARFVDGSRPNILCIDTALSGIRILIVNSCSAPQSRRSRTSYRVDSAQRHQAFVKAHPCFKVSSVVTSAWCCPVDPLISGSRITPRPVPSHQPDAG